MRRQGSPQKLEDVRRAAVALWRQGISPQQIAAALDRSVRTVYRCVATVRDHGPQELAAHWPSGAPRKLSGEQRDVLIGRLLQGAQAHGFETDLWTGPRVQRLIREQFGVEYHVKYIPTLLKTLGLSAQKPECRARERNEAEIAHWLECDWQRIKKKRAATAQ